MKSHLNFLPLVLILAGCCGGSDSFDHRSELKVDRPEEPPKLEEIDHGDGTITRKYPVDRSTYESMALRSDRAAPDPFAEPPTPTSTSGEGWPARKVLEKFDIPFPEEGESYATYDLKSELLTVRHEPEWVDYVQVVLESQESYEMVINVRLEIYEVPKALALRLEQSAGAHPDHRPEWEALEKIVRDGDARFVTSCNVRSRSGQRSTYRDGVDHLVFSKFEWDKTVDPPATRPRFDTRTVGTVVELDPVLGPDDKLIDLNLSIEHHTAPPETAPLEVPVPGNPEPVVIEAPVFHLNTLITQITINDGGTKLLCSWEPTGLPEFEGRDLMRIVFLRADVQRTSGGYPYPQSSN